MFKIRLSKDIWLFDPERPLGKAGGFGAVFEGTSEAGAPVAVKRLHVATDEAGHREIQMAEYLVRQSLENVLPVLDSGLDPELARYFLVMPRADMSLHDQLVARGKFTEKEATPILLDIARGLLAVDSIVHRDLKPHNVLRHCGNWKVADFGISRFVEAATSLRTLKDCMTGAYAAPEQLEFERTTKATDVYALGCVAYALLTGGPPFPGPTFTDFHRQHVEETPPSLAASVQLRQLVAAMLRKSPGARPDLPSVITQLTRAQQERSGAETDPLAAAGAHIASVEAAAEAAKSKAARELQVRRQLAKEAIEMLRGLMDDLFQDICETSLSAKRAEQEIRLGEGRIGYSIPFRSIQPDAFARSQWSDVVVGAELSVGQPGPHCNGRSANLWFADLNGQGVYRWWEVSYWSWGGAIDLRGPSALLGSDGVRFAALAVSGVTSGVQLVHPPRLIDGEHRDSFHTRWRAWLAACALNKMQTPSNLPEER